jgi:lysophospholipase L1-like esterase
MGPVAAIGAWGVVLVAVALAARRAGPGVVRWGLQLLAFVALAEVGLRLGFPGELGATDSSHSRNAWTVTDHDLPGLRRFPIPTALLGAPGTARDGRPRVVVVGDSFVAGEGVGPGDDVAHHLAARLDGFDVLNHGLSGLGFAEEAALYEELGRNAQADVVVWLFVLNDLPSASPSGAIAEAGLQGPFSDGIVDRTLEGGDGWGLALVDVPRVMWRRARVADVVAQAYRDGYDPAVSGAELDAFQVRLAGLVADQRARGGRFVFGVYPILYDLENAPFAAAHTELLRRAEAAGAEVLDLAPAFAGAPAEAWWASPTDHHPNAAGQAAVAARLAEQIRGAAVGRVAPPTCGADAFGAVAAGAAHAARASRCADPADPWAALALARAWLAAGHAASPGPFQPRKLALVHLHDALTLAVGRADEAAVRAEAGAVLTLAAVAEER